jgi:hypothetical protein
MRQLRDFRCDECGTTHEEYIDSDVRAVECPSCSGVATSIISPVRFTLEGTSGDFPTAYQKWDKRRQEKMKQEYKQGLRPYGQSDV